MLITLFNIGGLSDCIGWANTGIYDSTFAELQDLKVRLISGRPRYLWGEAGFLVSSAVCPENGRRKDFKFQKSLQAEGYKQAPPVWSSKDQTVTRMSAFPHRPNLLGYTLWGVWTPSVREGTGEPSATGMVYPRSALKKETWNEEEMKGPVKLK